MNLEELRGLVGTIVDYDPDIDVYRTEVNRVLNQLYMEFFTDKPWKFAQKTVQMTARADATATDGATNSTNQQVTTVASFFEGWMEGHIIEISGGSWSGTAMTGEYTIRKVVSATQIYLVGAAVVTGNATGATFTVKQRYIDLPEDCIVPLSLGIRQPASSSASSTAGQETRSFANLSKHLDEELDLDLDQTGRPTDWVGYDDLSMRQPVVAPTLTAGAGTLAAGTYYVRYTFVDNNRESGPSPAASIILTPSQKIDVANLQNTGTDSGLRKRVYLRTPESKAYHRVAGDVDETTTTKSTLALPASYLADKNRLSEHEGNYLRLRLYPRQDAAISVNLRYLYRPPMLIEDSDAPEFPAPHHRYLAYRACQELFIKHNNQSNSEVYRRKADAELLKMQNRHLTESNAHWVKAGFRHSPVWTNAEPKLTHTN